MHRDKYGIIVQADGDDGDSLHREGVYAFASGWHPNKVWNQLYNRTGRLDVHGWKEYRLQRGTTKWTDPNNVSRDQLIPLIACSAFNDHPNYLRRCRDHFTGPLMRAPNGDVGLTHISMFIRGYTEWQSRKSGVAHDIHIILNIILLHFTDLFFLAGAIIKIFPVRYNDQKKRLEWNDMDKVDDWNDVIPLLHAVRSYPTATSWLARTIYRTFRKKNHGRDLTPSYDRVYQALLWYNRASSGGNPELVELYKKDLETYFSTPSLIRKARQLMGRYGCYQK